MPETAAFNPPERILMGPGPSGANPRVVRAMGAPLVGHLDPEFLKIMDSIRVMLRQVFRTQNEVSLATPGTGTSGMEAAVMNLVQPGDKIVAGVCGYFGDRIVQMAERAGGVVTRVNAPWGSPVDAGDIEKAVKATGNVKLVTVVHAETSTGVRQPIEPISKIAHDNGALLLVDCVTSLGGVPVEIDAWGPMPPTPARRNASLHPQESRRSRSRRERGTPYAHARCRRTPGTSTCNCWSRTGTAAAPIITPLRSR